MVYLRYTFNHFRRVHVIWQPFYFKPTTLHPAEPCHLTFGKLMDCGFQLLTHGFIINLPYHILGHKLIFQAIIHKVVRSDPALKNPTHLVDHTFVQPRVKASGYSFPAHVAAISIPTTTASRGADGVTDSAVSGCAA